MMTLPPLKPLTMLKLGLTLAIALAFVGLALSRSHWKGKAEDTAFKLNMEREAHRITVDDFIAKTALAKEQDAANARRVAFENSVINEERTNALQKRLDDARARAGRLQPAPAPLDPGSGRKPVVSSLSPALPRTDAPAGQDRLFDADRLIATEQAIQLDELIKWVRAQGAVDVGSQNGAEASPERVSAR
jgi:hypothetical protein